MENKKNETNWGCLIFVAVFIIANLIYLFSSGKETISETGTLILVFAFIGGILLFLTKLSGDSSNNSSEKNTLSDNNSNTTSEDNTIHNNKQQPPNKINGCLIGAVVTIVGFLALGYIVNNTEATYIVGGIFAIVLAIVIGIYMYESGKINEICQQT